MTPLETTRVLTANFCPQNSLLRLIWEELGRRYPSSAGQSILIYGAGKFVKRLLRLIVPLANGPVIVGIVDDSATPGQTMSGHRVLKPDQVNPEDFSAVFLGTDYFEDCFAKRCRAAYGANCVILRYSKLVEEALSREQPRDGADAITRFLRPSRGDPFIDISSVWELAYGLCHHHECNEFKDNLLLAIALNIKPANTERVAEYGFALRQLTSGSGRLMDIGSSDSLFPYLLADKGFNVTCLDPIAKPSNDPRIEIMEGDIRKTSLSEGQFDVITCISTLEHIGLPGRYGITEADPDGERNAMKEMHRLLKPGGRLILTVPFGQYAMLPLNRVYSQVRIMELKGPLRCTTEEYYCIDREGSYLPATAQEASESDLRLDGYYALGCFVFERARMDVHARRPHEMEAQP